MAYLNVIGILFPGLMFEAIKEGFLVSVLTDTSPDFIELKKSKFIKTTLKLTEKYPTSFTERISNETLYYLTHRAELYVAGIEESVQTNAKFTCFSVIIVPEGVPHFFRRINGSEDGFVYRFDGREPFVKAEKEKVKVKEEVK